MFLPLVFIGPASNYQEKDGHWLWVFCLSVGFFLKIFQKVVQPLKNLWETHTTLPNHASYVQPLALGILLYFFLNFQKMVQPLKNPVQPLTSRWMAIGFGYSVGCF